MAKVEIFQNFRRKFKKIYKKNRKLNEDIEALIKILEENPTTGTFLSDDIYKIRIANSSKNIGKRGGFRVITYYLDENDVVYLVEIYEKNNIENIPIEQLVKIIQEEIKNFSED
jgi:mRNA-degrading endonuclease RelE of RelBE toxin-antitoxin system